MHALSQIVHVHSLWLKFDTQDPGPAYIRMRLPLARGPLDTPIKHTFIVHYYM
jgi:hypothetical protein